MGMPSVVISFKTSAANAIKRSDKGSIGMILRSSSEEFKGKAVSVKSVSDIPSGLDEKNKRYIKDALTGYVNPPKEIRIFFVADDAEDFTAATDYFEKTVIDYLVAPPDCTKEESENIVLWVKSCRQNNIFVKAVLANTAADSEGVINFTSDEINNGEKICSGAEYCARIAGIIAGTPMNISATYAPLAEVVDLKRLDKAAMDSAIEKGEFIIWHDGEKVKAGRAVNSLVTTTAEKGEAYKKIKVVEAVDMIRRDIRRTCEDSYIGKYPNSYDNKCLLITAIKAYLEDLERAEILKSGSSQVSIDIEAQRAHLEKQGINTDDMSEQEIKEAATGSVVYISGSITVLDAIEDVEIAFGLTV